MKKANSPKVAIIMGSDSDLPIMKQATIPLKQFKIPYQLLVISAHRTPQEMMIFSKQARSKGLQVIIAGAGGAAHLPGMVASMSELPVIGVPIPHGSLKGHDALLSIVQMPKGVPVATVAIANAYNAGLLAVQILAAGGLEPNRALLAQVLKYKATLRATVLKKSKKIKKQFIF